LFSLFINDIYNNCNIYGISVGDKRCCGGLFADDVVLCVSTRSQLKKLLMFASKWARNNEMQFGINKCASLVVRGEFSRFLYNSNPTFYLSSQELPKTNCFTYLGVPFSNDLELKSIIQRMNNKVRKALYSIKGFLKNPHIPIPYKRMLFSAIVIGQVSYYAPLLGSNKDRTRSTQTLVNSGLYWIEGFSKGNSFTSLYCVSKELNVPPLSAKCAIAQVRCFKKWKNSKCIISDLLRDISRCRRHTWDKESKILADKLNKFLSKKAILNFYWDRDMVGKSIKAKAYKNNNFEKTREYLKLNLK